MLGLRHLFLLFPLWFMDVGAGAQSPPSRVSANLLDGAIERIQVAQNDKVFVLTGPVELALDAVQPMSLVADEEPFGIRLAAVGNLQAVKHIQFTLTDSSGTSVEVGRNPMPKAPLEPVTTEIAPPPGLETYGSFRLEARALGAEGQPVGIPAELLLHRMRKARMADSPAPDCPFGLHYRTSHLDENIAVLEKTRLQLAPALQNIFLEAGGAK